MPKKPQLHQSKLLNTVTLKSNFSKNFLVSELPDGIFLFKKIHTYFGLFVQILNIIIGSYLRKMGGVHNQRKEESNIFQECKGTSHCHWCEY